LLGRKKVPFDALARAGERAKAACLHADIGEVDIAVDDVAYAVADLSRPQFIRDCDEGMKRSTVGSAEDGALFGRKVAPFEGAFENTPDARLDGVEQGPVQVHGARLPDARRRCTSRVGAINRGSRNPARSTNPS